MVHVVLSTAHPDFQGCYDMCFFMVRTCRDLTAAIGPVVNFDQVADAGSRCIVIPGFDDVSSHDSHSVSLLFRDGALHMRLLLRRQPYFVSSYADEACDIADR